MYQSPLCHHVSRWCASKVASPLLSSHNLSGVHLLSNIRFDQFLLHISIMVFHISCSLSGNPLLFFCRPPPVQSCRGSTLVAGNAFSHLLLVQMYQALVPVVAHLVLGHEWKSLYLWAPPHRAFSVLFRGSPLASVELWWLLLWCLYLSALSCTIVLSFLFSSFSVPPHRSFSVCPLAGRLPPLVATYSWTLAQRQRLFHGWIFLNIPIFSAFFRSPP